MNQTDKNMADLDIQGVIFDMDGLLFDTEALYIKSWPVVGEHMGLPITEEVARKTISRAGPETEEIFRAHYGSGFTLEKARPIIGKWIADYVAKHGLPVKPGAREIVQFVRDKGLPLALGSSNTKPVIEAFLEEAGLLSYFPIIVGGDMVARVKPAPDIFLRAAHELNLSPTQCLVFEDSLIGVEAAHAAGCVPVMVPDLLQPCAATRARCWRVIPGLEDAKGLFEGV